MDSRALQASLDRLWAGYIKELTFDTHGIRISFSIRVIVDGQAHEYSLVFEGVASFHYVYDEGERRLDASPVPPEGYLELTTVYYEPDGVGRIMIASGRDPWAERWWASANFFIEMWNHILLIEASRVIVNGQAFDVGYPTTSPSSNSRR